MPRLVIADAGMEAELGRFFAAVLPESGRVYEPEGRHAKLARAVHCFTRVWALLDGEDIVGTVAVAPLPRAGCCELKALYVSQRLQGRGWGRILLCAAMDHARAQGYREMYLDTLRTSARAISLYRGAGFVPTERYNDNPRAEVFLRRML